MMAWEGAGVGEGGSLSDEQVAPDERVPDERSPRSEKELQQLAKDMVFGRVFFDWMIPEENLGLLTSIFLVLVFMEKAQIEALRKAGLRSIYEYYDQATTRTINGFPTFLSFQWLSHEEWPIFWKHVNAYQTAIVSVEGEE